MGHRATSEGIPFVVQNALAKVQHQDMECTSKSATSEYGFIPPEWAISTGSRMNLLSPSGSRRYFAEVSLVEGECEFWDLSMSRVRTQPPSACSGVSFFLVCFWSVFLRPRWRLRSLAAVSFACSLMHA